MNARLALFRATPTWLVRRPVLRALTDATAAAFACRPPRSAGRGDGGRLRAYASFTAARAWQALGEPDTLPATRARLRERALELGCAVRRGLRLRGAHEAMAAARVLYRIIGIDFRGEDDGRITIRSCAFSRFYAPEVCRLVSSLDEGVLSGLAGEGSLTFRRRITEGAARCEACFRNARGGS